MANMVLSDFIDRWMVTKKKIEVKPATYNRLVISVNSMKQYKIAQIPICQITSEDFSAYIRELIATGYSVSTIKKQMEIVSAPLRYAWEQGIIPINPCLGARTPSKVLVKKRSREVLAFTPKEQEALLAHLDPAKHDAHAAILFMLHTGLRVGEVLALRWDDINLNRRSVHIHATLVNPSSTKRSYVQEGAKSDSSNRIIPLSDAALEVLLVVQQKMRSSDMVFCNESGDPLSYKALLNHCKNVCNAAKVEYKGLHVWRHTFATNLYYRGVDVKILSKLLGHSNTSVTYNIYINLYGDGFDDMLKALS